MLHFTHVLLAESYLQACLKFREGKMPQVLFHVRGCGSSSCLFTHVADTGRHLNGVVVLRSRVKTCFEPPALWVSEPLRERGLPLHELALLLL